MQLYIEIERLEKEHFEMSAEYEKTETHPCPSLYRVSPDHSSLLWVQGHSFNYKTVRGSETSDGFLTFTGPDILPALLGLGLDQLRLEPGQSDLLV